MNSKVYALVDCNNFFVSCERSRNPQLIGKPVIVLSNNDGGVVARSNEAKALGIGMSEPLFKIRDIIRKHDVKVISGELGFYKSISKQIMRIITDFWPEVEIYSIDEAFLDLSSLGQHITPQSIAWQLIKKIMKKTKIPVSVGIAPTHTLAKIANHYAKKQTDSRVYHLENEEQIKKILESYDIADVWGFGRKLTAKFNAMGVVKVSQLLKLPETLINDFNVVVRRSIYELRGISCIKLRDSRVDKQQIMVSRSFPHRLLEQAPIMAALAAHVATACERLRRQKSVASGVYVFLTTSSFEPNGWFYKNSLYCKLPAASSDTRIILHHAKYALNQIFKSGFRYKKVGVVLCDISSEHGQQLDIFNLSTDKDTKLILCVDEINKALGAGTIGFAGVKNKLCDLGTSFQS